MTQVRLRGVLAALAVLGWTACGDNGNRCGDGTIEVDGICLPETTTTCGDGTKLEDGHCVIDPLACQAGTVLIAGHCTDPTRVPVVDLEESFEPNGLAIVPGVELSAAPAGVIALAAGTPFVIHGHITPFRDADGDGQLDPDIDTYLVTVTGPTLLSIAVDGLGGVQGAFFVTGDKDGPVPGYERYGLPIAGDSSQRRLILPAAGRYAIAITDTRSLALGKNPPRPAGAGGAAGSASAEYYATILQEPFPAPTAIASTGALTTQTGTLGPDDTKVFAVVLGPGHTEVRDTMTGAAAASICLVVNAKLRACADETPTADPKIAIDGASPADSAIVLVDTVYNYGSAPEPFTLTITR
jgi:hypothetical protein